MRPPLRAVGDDDVDRPQVRAWRHVEPSGTNGPKASALLCAAAVVSAFTPSREGRPRDEWRQCAGAHLFPFRTEKLSPAAAMILRESVGKQPAAHPQRELGGFPVFGSGQSSRDYPPGTRALDSFSTRASFPPDWWGRFRFLRTFAASKRAQGLCLVVVSRWRPAGFHRRPRILKCQIC